MLKWRYSSEENDRQVKLVRVRRAGIELQRRSIAKAVCLQKFKELKETADFQAKFIDRLMLDKENSLRLLDSVMAEFSALEKQIKIAEDEIVFEKDTNRKLRTELSHWKTECANLTLCARLLQGELDRVKHTSRSRNTRDELQETRPMRTTDTITKNSSAEERRLSLDETFQNLENESRLEFQGGLNVNPGLNETVFSRSDMFVASDFEHGKSQTNSRKKTIIPPSTLSSRSHQQRSPASPKTIGCFRRFRFRIGKRKVYSLPQPTVIHSHHVIQN
ncbi:uncharacterized protein LOC135465539 [Liolophura sinensis]|uniref:uncharacterized protein LOC135465539 n=1 Tax=Liolophura sinensis TaxID=3198878 RepID=UPI00315949CF